MPHLGVSFPESFTMALDEQQKLLSSGRTQLQVSIVEVGSTPQPSPLSDRSSQQLLDTPLDVVAEATFCQGVNTASLLLESPPKWGEAARYASKQHRKIAGRATFQGQVYNFLERPDNWKCFVYHIVVNDIILSPRLRPSISNHSPNPIPINSLILPDPIMLS
nr:potassium voltage-gated channel subfamily KQT member 1-like [Onthophagus taurus]